MFKDLRDWTRDGGERENFGAPCSRLCLAATQRAKYKGVREEAQVINNHNTKQPPDRMQIEKTQMTMIGLALSTAKAEILPPTPFFFLSLFS